MSKMSPYSGDVKSETEKNQHTSINKTTSKAETSLVELTPLELNGSTSNVSSREIRRRWFHILPTNRRRRCFPFSDIYNQLSEKFSSRPNTARSDLSKDYSRSASHRSLIINEGHENAGLQRNKIFMVTGVNIEDKFPFSEQFVNLGVSVSLTMGFDPTATHLVCENLICNAKSLAAMARGLWILHISYVTDSVVAGKLLNEEEYEFGNPKAMPKLKLDSEGLQKASAARYWREEIMRRGYGAFYDINAIILTKDKESLMCILQAGGATIVETSPPFGINIGATHCFIGHKDKSYNIDDCIDLAKQGTLCINAQYVNDFLLRTGWLDIQDFLLPALYSYY